MSVLWDPYLPLKHLDVVIKDDEGGRDQATDGNYDTAVLKTRSGTTVTSSSCNGDAKFCAPDQWDYVYDIEIWHKKAVLDQGFSYQP